MLIFLDEAISIAYTVSLRMLCMIAHLSGIENKNIQFGSKIHKKDVLVIKTNTSLINLF